MLGPLSQTNTVPMLGLLHRVRAPGKVKVGACALSARTFITSEHGSDARLRNNVQKTMAAQSLYVTIVKAIWRPCFRQLDLSAVRSVFCFLAYRLNSMKLAYTVH